MAPTFNPLIFGDEFLRVRAIPKGPTSTGHTSTVFWCHGKGQRGGDWQFMIEPLRKLGHCNHICFIFPYLDYDAKNAKNEKDSLSKNEALIQKIVRAEIANGADPDRIVVGGYNEGLNVALLAALADDRTKIGGVVGIADKFVVTDEVKALRKSTNTNTPVSVVDRSGAKDNVGEKALARLGQAIGAIIGGSKNASTGTEPVTPEEIVVIETFLHKALPVENAAKDNYFIDRD